MNEQERKSFEEAARPLIKWMAEQVHPEHTAVVSASHAELLETKCRAVITDYIKD